MMTLSHLLPHDGQSYRLTGRTTLTTREVRLYFFAKDYLLQFLSVIVSKMVDIAYLYPVDFMIQFLT